MALKASSRLISTPFSWALAPDLAADLVFLASPVRGECVEQIAVARNALILVLPGGAVRFGEDRILALLQVREKGAPIGCDRSRIFLKALVQVFDVGGVRALKKRG